MEKTGKKNRFAQIALIFSLLAGGALIVTGILAGDPAAVLQKAIRICMECVGIG